MEQMMEDSFGELLRSFRKRKRFSQQTLADLLGVHRNTISIWERGDFLPESKTMVLEVARQLSLNDQETRLLLEASLTALSSYWHVPFPRNPFFTGTMWENIGPDGTATESRTSLAHGWASGPTPIMTGYVLGVQPVNPGYQTFTVVPHFGSLVWAEGAVPTPYGQISVRWTHLGRAFALTVRVPAGTTAVVSLPDGRHATVSGGAHGAVRTFTG